MRRFILTFALVALVVTAVTASAGASTGSNNAARVMRLTCEGLTYTPHDFRVYAGKVYKHLHIKKDAKAKLALMYVCQPSGKARAKVGRILNRDVAYWREYVLCSNARPVPCIQQAAAKFHVAFNWLLNCARSEGGIGPFDYKKMNTAGSGAGGNFQFMSGTLYGYAPRAGIRHPTWLNSHDQAFTAAYMFSIGQSGQWTGAGC